MKKLTDYKTIVVDFDGTLYYHMPVKILMFIRMAVYYFTHPHKLFELNIVIKYRRAYNNNLFESERLNILANRFELTHDQIKKLINRWMIVIPLPYIHFFRDKLLISSLKNAQKTGVKLIVLSDHPVSEKIKVIGFTPDCAYSAEDLGVYKPNPEGLLNIFHKHGINSCDCLIIGDRMDKDGALAIKLNMDFIILSKWKCKRKKFFKE